MFRAVVACALSAVVAACSSSPTAPAAPGHPTGNSVSSVALGHGPWGASISANGIAYVTRPLTDSIARISLAGPRPSVVKSFKVGPRPDEVVFNASGSTAYVTNINNASVGIINTATDVQTQTFPVLGAPLRVTLSRDESALYVTLDNGNLVVLNATTGAVSATLPVGTTPNGIALNPVSARLYVTATGTGMLTEVNTATNTVVRTIFVGGTPQDIVALPERNTLYIACESGFVDVRNLETGARTDSIPVTGAFRLALTPDAKQLWVTQSSRGRISVIDVASSDVIDVVETLGAPRHIAFSPGGAAALVANEAGVVQIVR